MRNPNGYGGVSRLPGNRRKPFRARVTSEWVEHEDGGKRQRFITLGYYATRSEAMRALAEFNHTPYSMALRHTTFMEVYLNWSPNYFEKYPSTCRVTRCAMLFCRKIWDKPIRDLRPAQLQDVLRSMEDKSRGYQSKVRSLMHMLYRWAMSRDIVDRDWSQFVELTSPERQSPRTVFTHDEIETLWRLRETGGMIPGEPAKYRGWGMLDSVLVLLYTGMRVGELLALRRENVNLDGRFIDLFGTKTKAARRHVPIHKDLLPVITDMLGRVQSQFLLSSPQGEGLTYSQYKYGWFDKAMEGLGFRHTPHDARHTFVSGLDTAEVRRGAVKFIVGHSQRDVTDRYTHKDISELIAEVDKLTY